MPIHTDPSNWMDNYYSYAPTDGFYPDSSSSNKSPHLFTDSHIHNQEAQPDEANHIVSPQESLKSKRRQTSQDHVKHKRTRSGCYTCRMRRVKCDETHPICDRCRKGQRECSYPEQNNRRPSNQSKSSKSTQQDSASSTSDDESETSKSKLPTILDEDGDTGSEPPVHDSLSPLGNNKQPATNNDKARRPQALKAVLKQNASRSLAGPKWATIPKDVRHLLKYHRENVTVQHYNLKIDDSNFLHTTFIEIALSYEPLLYAITAFASYFHTLAQPNGNLQDILKYYNKSVSLLRESLAKATRHSTAMLLTILQIAALEEYLGDWVNVLKHQKAAYEVLTQLFTPETIMQNETRRKIIAWYMRFDLVTCLISGLPPLLSRDWYESYSRFHARQLAEQPEEVAMIAEEMFADFKLLAWDLALVFGQKQKGLISDEEFASQQAVLKASIDDRRSRCLAACKHAGKYVTSFPNFPKDRIDLFESTRPDYLLTDPYWPLNLVLIDWYGLELLYLGNLSKVDMTVDPTQFMTIGLKICQLFEGFEYASENRQSAILGSHASLGLAFTVVPHDEQYKLWCKEKMALVEECGYFYQSIFRTRLLEIWGMNADLRWWQDGMPYSPILRQIRDFFDYRTRHPDNEETDSLRDLKGVFKAMSLDEDPHKHGIVEPPSVSSTTSWDAWMGDTSSDLWTNTDTASPDQWDVPPSAGSGSTQLEWY